MVEDPNQPERPRLEPEIIPPGQNPPDWRQQRSHQRTWQPFFSTAAGTHRVYVARLGPFGFALMTLILGVVVALIMLAVVGAVLIWIPAVLLLVAVGALVRFLRR